jgi:hypothetical protein
MIYSLPITSSRALAAHRYGLVVAAFAALTWLAWPAAQAHACSCMATTPRDAAQAASTVFEGRVLRVDKGDPNAQVNAGHHTVDLQVVRYFKGEGGESITLQTASNSAACGIEFEIGGSYLVYANTNEGSGLWAGLCSGTRPMAGAEADLEHLGMGSTPFDPGAGSDQKQPPSETPSAAPAAHQGGCASCSIGVARNRQNAEAGVLALAGFLIVIARGVRRGKRRSR